MEKGSPSPPFTRRCLLAAGIRVPEVKFEESIRAFEREDAVRPGRKARVVFYGDSDVLFWTREGVFEDIFAGLGAVNRGFGGARTWETLLYLHRVLPFHAPRVVVYNCGDNDVAALGKEGPPNVERCVALFLDTLAEILPESRCVCLAVHPAPRRDEQGLRDLQRKANEKMERVCRVRKNVRYVDYTFMLFDERGGFPPGIFLDDGLHYTPAFYRRFGAFLRPLIEEMLHGGGR